MNPHHAAGSQRDHWNVARNIRIHGARHFQFGSLFVLPGGDQGKLLGMVDLIEIVVLLVRDNCRRGRLRRGVRRPFARAPRREQEL